MAWSHFLPRPSGTFGDGCDVFPVPVRSDIAHSALLRVRWCQSSPQLHVPHPCHRWRHRYHRGKAAGQPPDSDVLPSLPDLLLVSGKSKPINSARVCDPTSSQARTHRGDPKVSKWAGRGPGLCPAMGSQPSVVWWSQRGDGHLAGCWRNVCADSKGSNIPA